MERPMARHLLLIHLMTLSLLLGDGTVQISLANGQEVQGEFIGTYMDHVHVLTGEKLYYYACGDIRSITSKAGETFDYDCSENTVTADILFPPVLDPMTGEWAQKLPDVFNPNIAHPVVTTETDGIGNEKDHIVINGVKYMRAASDKETDQGSIPITTTEEVIFQATQAAQQMARKSFHQILGVGSCLFSSIGIPASILYVEFLADSKMDPGNPFYMDLDPGQKVVYEQFYKKEEKRLRRKGVYGTEGTCLLMLIGWIFLAIANDS